MVSPQIWLYSIMQGGVVQESKSLVMQDIETIAACSACENRPTAEPGGFSGDRGWG
jgi:hypothetical protein